MFRLIRLYSRSMRGMMRNMMTAFEKMTQGKGIMDFHRGYWLITGSMGARRASAMRAFASAPPNMIPS